MLVKQRKETEKTSIFQNLKRLLLLRQISLLGALEGLNLLTIETSALSLGNLLKSIIVFLSIFSEGLEIQEKPFIFV
jgi:hypothetical protein